MPVSSPRSLICIDKLPHSNLNQIRTEYGMLVRVLHTSCPIDGI